MSQRSVLEYPDPRLRREASPVSVFDAGLSALVDDLLETLQATKAVALSAPQVDDARAVLVMNPGDGWAPQVYVNPELLAKSAWGLVEESCLSLPGVVGNVVRATEVRVRAQDRDGQSFERDLSGLAAVCLQHEMDHLVGKLFVDRMTVFQKLRFHAFAGKRARRRSRAA